MSSRLAAFVIWALVAGTGVFWGIRFLVHAAPAPMQVATADVGSLTRGDLSRLLGSDPVVQAPVASPGMAQQLGGRLRLTGVAAPRQHGGPGLAVISVDGNPPRVYRVGALIDSNLVLHDVSMRTATVAMVQSGSDPASEVVLEMPPLAAAATGVLPPAAFPAAYPHPEGQPAPNADDGRDALSDMAPPLAGPYKKIFNGLRAR
jgi:general secretion pathway protein C